MKTLYFDCSMGAAGDMLTAALLELMPDADAALAELNAIGIPHVVFEASRCVKCGVAGTHVRVLAYGAEEDAAHSHAHSTLASITQLVDGLRVDQSVRRHILAVYKLIAEAESLVHGCPVDQIHFHEIGTLDAVADIAAVCLLLAHLEPDRILASPVHVGSGTVRCAHGILPVPAPATAELLRGIPIYGGSIAGELCTPTGAALLRHFVSEFRALPLMRTDAVGYGMGKKDFPAANCVRAMIGQTDEPSTETMLELSANVDDMTAEQIAFAMERLFSEGASEVYTIPVGMKKSRPGTLLRAICRPELRESIVRAIFLHTSTIGVRETQTRRYVLRRTVTQRDTSLGPVRVKRSEGYGVVREKAEYEDLARIARERGISLEEANNRTERELEIHGI